MRTSTTEAELRLVGAAQLLNHAFIPPEGATTGNWAEAQRLKSEAWDLLYQAWFALRELDKEGNVYVAETDL